MTRLLAGMFLAYGVVFSANSAAACMDIYGFDQRLGASNSTYVEILFKATLDNACERRRSAVVEFCVVDRDGFQLDCTLRRVSIDRYAVRDIRADLLLDRSLAQDAVRGEVQFRSY